MASRFSAPAAVPSRSSVTFCVNRFSTCLFWTNSPSPESYSAAALAPLKANLFLSVSPPTHDHCANSSFGPTGFATGAAGLASICTSLSESTVSSPFVLSCNLLSTASRASIVLEVVSSQLAGNRKGFFLSALPSSSVFVVFSISSFFSRTGGATLSAIATNAFVAASFCSIIFFICSVTVLFTGVYSSVSTYACSSGNAGKKSGIFPGGVSFSSANVFPWVTFFGTGKSQTG
mmetsp:Transcript_954/g.1992  ORF Transcript_954/g.1992 Transcript_954/m.1992 type:complete len:233 (+) Transcript_954:2172-2870(+)